MLARIGLQKYTVTSPKVVLSKMKTLNSEPERADGLTAIMPNSTQKIAFSADRFSVVNILKSMRISHVNTPSILT